MLGFVFLNAFSLHYKISTPSALIKNKQRSPENGWIKIKPLHLEADVNVLNIYKIFYQH